MAITRKDFWQHFGQGRFTKADLWKAFGYNDHPGFPTDDFMSGLDLEARDYIVTATGPRGSTGWRLSDIAVVDLMAEEQQAQRRHETFQALVQTTSLPYGQLSYAQYAQTIQWRLKLPFFSRVKEWKSRAKLHQSTNVGWELAPGEIAPFTQPAAFYLCEPLRSGFHAVSIYERRILEHFVSEGTQHFGTREEIFDMVGIGTMEMIRNHLDDDGELLESVLLGNLINFVTSQIAQQAIGKRQYRH